MATPLTKSVLITGPPGSGKHTLLNMICTELRATLMDLTAANIAGKYPGKPGLKMLMHLVDKVGHAVQPVVILIDNCQKMFQKKVPKDDKTEPKRLKKTLPKFLKSLTGEDLFLLVGISSEPWLAGMKSLKKTYNRIIYIPPSDYATRFEMWKKSLNEHPDLLDDNISYSLLAKLSAGWTVGNIRDAISEVFRKHKKEVAKQQRDRRADMNPWGHLGNLVVRQMIIGKLTITMDNLIECMGDYDPVFLEQEKTWTKWWNKTPLQKQRLSTIVAAGGGDKKKKGDKKGDKKGKKGKK